MLLALFATVGFGSIVAAWIARRTVISGFRQAWINALRDDFAEMLRLQNVVTQFTQLRASAEVGGDHEKMHQNALKILEAQNSVLALYYRVITRLNQTDRDHAVLVRRLTDVISSQELSASDPIAISVAVAAAQAVFKREWEVTKFGMFAGAAGSIKRHLRLTFSLRPREGLPVEPVTQVLLPAKKVQTAALQVWSDRVVGHSLAGSMLSQDRTDWIEALAHMAEAAVRSDPAAKVAITVEQFRWIEGAYERHNTG